jgi:hypothetical protein
MANDLEQRLSRIEEHLLKLERDYELLIEHWKSDARLSFKLSDRDTNLN